jgi:succinate-semialdehyde dehydrogenase/glutarate-semialdehyde dehydrogenase
VLTGVPHSVRLTDEIFGPVAPVTSFASEEEAVSRANDTLYGLAGYLCTRDTGRALRVAERLDVGMIGLNQGLVSDPAAPFGGVKASGFGRAGGGEGTEGYLRTTYVGMPGEPI